MGDPTQLVVGWSHACLQDKWNSMAFFFSACHQHQIIGRNAVWFQRPLGASSLKVVKTSTELQGEGERRTCWLEKPPLEEGHTMTKTHLNAVKKFELWNRHQLRHCGDTSESPLCHLAVHPMTLLHFWCSPDTCST